jgi:hypothetical protein
VHLPNGNKVIDDALACLCENEQQRHERNEQAIVHCPQIRHVNGARHFALLLLLLRHLLVAAVYRFAIIIVRLVIVTPLARWLLQSNIEQAIKNNQLFFSLSLAVLLGVFAGLLKQVEIWSVHFGKNY